MVDFLGKLETTYNCKFLFEPQVVKGLVVALEVDHLQQLSEVLADIGEQHRLEFEEIEPDFWVLKPAFHYGLLQGHVYNVDGEPLIGASLYDPLSERGTATDIEGYYELWLPSGDVNLQVSFIGYQPLVDSCWISYGQHGERNFTLQSSLDLVEVIVEGHARNSLAFLAPPTPAEKITAEDIARIPVTELGQLLQFLAPSFHTTYQTNSDGTDHIDPAALRGLGPDQLLILVDGKRRHSSALVNVNSTVGRGSVATDLNAIPLSAIDRIEILPDGATAQYGADAIAGVINLVLKDSTAENNVRLLSGITQEGDGRRLGLDGHQQLWRKPNSYGNLSWRLDYRSTVNRSGNYQGLIFGDDRDENTTARAAFFRHNTFRDERVMNVGSAAISNAGVHWNGQFQLQPNNRLYTYVNANVRRGRAGGFYRFPYQLRKQSGLYDLGFSPTISPRIADVSAVLGWRTQHRQWEMDISGNTGWNFANIYVENSNNASLGLSSPTSAMAGRLRYGQHIAQVDLVRPSTDMQPYVWRLGASWRNEYFQQLAGDEWSWQNYGDTTRFGEPKEAGIQVFPGYRPDNTVRAQRHSWGAYWSVERYFGKTFYPMLALRWEYWPGSGHALLGKVAGNYQLSKQLRLQLAYNTGLRPPALAQQYFSSQSLQFVPDGIKLRGQEVAQLNSKHPLVQSLINGPLQAESSRNLSLGIAWRLRPNMKLTTSAYRIGIRNRIVLGSRLKGANSERLRALLAQHELGSVQFFTNALTTRTYGLDIGLQQHWRWREWCIQTQVSGSFNHTDVQTITLSETLQGLESQIFNREEEARLERAQPASKLIGRFTFQRKAWSIAWQATRFGSVAYWHPDDGQSDNWVVNQYSQQVESRDQVFTAKWLHDFSVHWERPNNFRLGLHLRNIFNTYPDTHKHFANTNDGVFRYSRYVQQFGVWGRYFTIDIQVTI